MKKTSRISSLVAALLSGACFFTAVDGRADGLVLTAADLDASSRTSLEKDIAAFEAANPDIVTRVRDVDGVKPDIYKTFRNPIPLADRELKSVGAPGLLPMLDALAFDASQPSLNADEKHALVIGMITAVGNIRDARSAPVLKAIFERQSSSNEIAENTAEALGKLCRSTEITLLTSRTTAGDPLRQAAISGLGKCRSKAGATALIGLLPTATDDAIRATIVEAMGALGSSWAWAAKGPSAAAEGDEARVLLTKALIDVFVAHPNARATASHALSLCDHATADGLVASVRGTTDTTTQAALDQLAKRLARLAKRRAAG